MINSTPARLLVGLLTVLPFVYLAWFLTTMSSPSVFASRADFDHLFRIHMFASFGIFALIGCSIIYLFRTQRVPQSKKALWAVVLFLGNMMALPVFWYIYIRPAQWPQQHADL